MRIDDELIESSDNLNKEDTMKMQHLGVMLTIGALIVGCSSLPKVTRTGTVKDVLISESVNPKEVDAKVGDEIRYINKRTGEVKVVFLDEVGDRYSCNNGFGGMMGMMSNREASLSANEAASVCFNKPGTYKYNVRMESDRPMGARSMTGSVKVEQ